MWILYINGERYGQNRNLVNAARDLVGMANDWMQGHDDVITRIEYCWFDDGNKAPDSLSYNDIIVVEPGDKLPAID